MEAVILSAKGICRSFGRNQVLCDLDFEVTEGETIAVTGQSGAGKTTLLHILGGLDRQSAGTLTYRGKTLQRRDLRTYRRDAVGYLFQESCLIEELTVLKNIEAAIRISGRDADARDYLAKVGLEEKAKQYPSQLSGGQARRVALARALAKQPSLLLLDEPTEGLDDETGMEMIRLTQTLCSEKHITMIMVTHHRFFAEQMQRCVKLSQGRLI